MLRAQPPLADRQGPQVQGLGLAVAPLGAVEQRQVVEARGGGRMVGAEDPLAQRQDPLAEGLGRVIAPLRPVEPGQVVEARGGVRMVGAEQPLAQRQGLLQEGLGLGIPTLALKVKPHQIERLGFPHRVMPGAGHRARTLCLGIPFLPTSLIL